MDLLQSKHRQYMSSKREEENFDGNEIEELT